MCKPFLLLSLEKRGWERFEKFSLIKLAFQIPLANATLARIRHFAKGGKCIYIFAMTI